MTLEQVLEKLEDDADAFGRLKSAIWQRRIGLANLDLTLDAYGVRNTYRDAVIANRDELKANGGIWIRDHFKVAKVMRKMGIQVDELIDHVPFPFHQWPSGWKALILVGTRMGQLKLDQQPPAEFDMLSVKDDTGRTELSAELLSTMKCEIEVRHVDSSLSYDEAEAMMAELLDDEVACRNSRLGAVIGIGAPPALSLAEPLARRILLDHLCPYQFRWCHRFPMSKFQGRRIVLSQLKNCDYRDEGLAMPCADVNELHRRRQNVTADYYKGMNGKSHDCGIVLMNRYFRPGRPRLFLLAGHGGNATLAATHALFGNDLRKCLVQHDQLPDVEYALIKVRSSCGDIKPFGRNCGWNYHRGIVIKNDSDDEAA